MFFDEAVLCPFRVVPPPPQSIFFYMIFEPVTPSSLSFFSPLSQPQHYAC